MIAHEFSPVPEIYVLLIFRLNKYLNGSSTRILLDSFNLFIPKSLENKYDLIQAVSI